MNYLEIVKKHKWIILILIIASFLRLYHLGFQGAWLDEVHTLKESDPKLSFSEFHQTIMFREGIPHFYFLLIRFLSELIGSNIFTARLVSAIVGIASVWFIYLLGKELYNKQAGNIAAILLTFNLFHIEYSQEARSYSLLTFLVIISFYFLVLFVKKINLKNAILLGFFSGLITNAQPIGIVNVLAIYLVLLIVLIYSDAKDRQKVFIYSFFSGIVSLIVFSPVYQIVIKVSEIKNMWIPAPTFDSIIQVFILLSGKSKAVFFITLFFITLFIIALIYNKLQNKNKLILNDKIAFSFTVLLVWILLEIGIIIGKSYIGESIVLHRYFIGILPAFMLFLAIGLELIKNNLIKISALVIILGFMIYNVITPNNYYSTRTKSQYDKVCEEIIKRNIQKDKIVSNWGWLLSYYLNSQNNSKPVLESSLENYVDDLKNGAVNAGSFWYVDGNSRPYILNEDLKKYLNDNFIVTDKIEEYDAWAYHFKSKNTNMSNLILDLTSFESAAFDGTGTMIFVENKTIKHPPVSLEKGKYKIIVKGISLPYKPLNNENAHFNVIIDNNKIGDFSLSEKKESKDIEIFFEINTSKEITLQLNYDNDELLNGIDRNAIINYIKIIKE